MPIPPEFPTDPMRHLDSHQGDGLHDAEERASTEVIQHLPAASQPQKAPQGRAADWAHPYSRAARPMGAETTKEARMAHDQEKYGV